MSLSPTCVSRDEASWLQAGVTPRPPSGIFTGSGERTLRDSSFISTLLLLKINVKLCENELASVRLNFVCKSTLESTYFPLLQNCFCGEFNISCFSFLQRTSVPDSLQEPVALVWRTQEVPLRCALPCGNSCDCFKFYNTSWNCFYGGIFIAQVAVSAKCTKSSVSLSSCSSLIHCCRFSSVGPKVKTGEEAKIRQHVRNKTSYAC